MFCKRYVLLFLCSVSSVHVHGDPVMTSGTYNQLYTNSYVDATTEIDWKCTKVHVTITKPPNDNDARHIAFHKTANLHGGPQQVRTPTVSGSIEGNTLTLDTSVLDIHPYDNDTVVLTGTTNPSFYVWTRSANTSSEPADIPRMMAFANKLGLSAPVKLVQTYNHTVCNGTTTPTP